MNKQGYEVIMSYRQASLANSPSIAVFLSKVYGWMALALLVTAGVSALSISFSITAYMTANPGVFIGLVIAELITVGVIAKKSTDTTSRNGIVAFVLLMFYAGLNGVTMSAALSAAKGVHIAGAFIISSAVFVAAAAYGLLTKRSLIGFGQYLMLALVGLLIALVVNLFLRSSIMEMIVSGIAVILFTILIAYDSQKLQRSFALYNDSTAAVDGALNLYLDFINIFLHILRLLSSTSTSSDD